MKSPPPPPNMNQLPTFDPARAKKRPARRSEGLSLVTVLLVLFICLGLAALALDLLRIVSSRAELQKEADAIARQEVQTVELPGKGPISRPLTPVERTITGRSKTTVQYGHWEPRTRRFTPDQKNGRAARIVMSRLPGGSRDAPLLFQTFFHLFPFTTTVESVAIPCPREIVLAVDLSGSMNDDAEPCWATEAINESNQKNDRKTLGDRIAAQLYEDLELGDFPGPSEYLTESISDERGEYAYAALTRDEGPLTAESIPETYRIVPGDNEAARKRKAYAYLIDHQLARLMPEASPKPDSKTAYEFWAKYLDYVIRPYPDDPSWPVGQGTLPPGQSDNRLVRFNNPAQAITIPVPKNLPKKYENLLGYRTYVQFLCDFGRDLHPIADEYVALSVHSQTCPWHSEETPGGTFRFPPRTQPMHAIRRALVATLAKIEEANAAIKDPDWKDRVSIVVFDRIETGGGRIAQPLTTDYQAAMQTAAQLQAAGDRHRGVPTDAGLLTAVDSLKKAEPRKPSHTAKVLLLVTNAPPDAMIGETDAIRKHLSTQRERADYYPGWKEDSRLLARNAALIAAERIRADGWHLFPIGIGQEVDRDFLDRMARIGTGNAEDAEKAPVCNRPGTYEKKLTDVLESILSKPVVRVVQ